MFKQTLKRMVLTGATVMVLLSAAAPAMAAPATFQEEPSDGYIPIPACALKPWLCGGW
jgi:hypothetical protein